MRYLDADEVPVAVEIVDEAQDLSAAMIRLLHRLVGDEPDAFNLIGDGQQSIYPGGYTLGELGISIAGRGVVMTRNYRNTREIATFAASLVGDSGFVDIESGLRGRMDAAEVLREGAAPSIARFASVAAHDAALVARVRELLATPGVHPGDVAVLAMRTRDVSSAVKLLGAAGVPVVDLAKYDGRVSAAVKVGTIKRAKGLEFKHALVAHTPARLVGPAAVPENGQDAGERVEMERRELYVAMTRARTGFGWEWLRPRSSHNVQLAILRSTVSRLMASTLTMWSSIRSTRSRTASSATCQGARVLRAANRGCSKPLTGWKVELPLAALLCG